MLSHATGAEIAAVNSDDVVTGSCSLVSLRGRHPRSLTSMRRITSSFPMFLAVYSLLYAAFGVQSPFLPALFRERGLHAEEIGMVLDGIRVLADCETS